MRSALLGVTLALFVFGLTTFAAAQQPQTPPPPNASYYPTDPMGGILVELTKISGSVNSLTRQMKAFVDKFEKVGGSSFNEKQQKLILGMELLTRAEARVAVLQKAQIELTEKLNETRTKLTQNEIDLRPGGVEKSVVYEGTTRTDEIREARRTRLQSERVSLTQLNQQIQ